MTRAGNAGGSLSRGRVRDPGGPGVDAGIGPAAGLADGRGRSEAVAGGAAGQRDAALTGVAAR